MMNIDPTTGLPQLPEGYRWRISKRGDSSYGIQFYVFRIEKPAPPTFWSSLLPSFSKEEWVTDFKSEKAFHWRSDNIQRFTKAAAVEAYKDYMGDINLDSIVGTYPPKRLDTAPTTK